jgi:PAS domain S-box-containing protein
LSRNSALTPYWNRLETWFLAAAFLILVTTTFVGWRNWHQFSLARIEAEKTRELQELASSILASVLDAEDADLAFLLTGDATCLDPYRRDLKRLPDEFQKLQAAAPEKAGSLRRLKMLVDQKLIQLKQSIIARQTSGVDAAVGVVLSGNARSLTQQIEELAQQIMTTETNGFQARTAAAANEARDTLMVNTFGDVVLSILLFLSAIAMHRGSSRREELIAALQEDESHLRDLRLKAEAAEEQVRSILESIGDGFLSFDHAGVITYCNAEAARLIGRPKPEIVGKNIFQDFPEVAGEDVLEKYRQVEAQKKPVTFETFLKGRNAWLEKSVYPSHDGLSVYFRDITDRRYFEERSRHAQKLESLGVLAGGIAHDFNNLLTAILGSASLIMDDLPQGSPLRPYADNVISASERASQLTRQMLAYSGRGHFIVEPLDLVVQVREIVHLLEASVTSKVELVLDLQSSGVLIEADPSQIQQLVMNLVINGAEAMESNGGRVVVSTRIQELDAQFVMDNLAGDEVEPGTFVLLEVQDAGQGMDQSTIARIFDPFFTTKFTGRGLGLAAVLGIVRGHRGAIKVYSNPGKGTSFKVYLPVIKGQLTAKPPSLLMDYRGSATVLIVDDEESVQRLGSATLERYGYRVLLASDGKQALDVFRAAATEISLVLLDMTMPLMSGEETLNQLKKLRPSLRVIASSGYSEVEALRHFGTGITSFLQKPYRAADLAEKVKLALQ